MVMNEIKSGQNHPNSQRWLVPLGLKAMACLLGLGILSPAHAQPPMVLLTGEQTVAQLKEDGTRYMQMGFSTLAIHAYRAALELEDKTLVLPSERDPDVPFNLGLIYARQGQLAEARAAFQRAVEVDPKSFKARYQLALVNLKLGDRGAAKEQLTLLAHAALGHPETYSHIESLLATLDAVPLPSQEEKPEKQREDVASFPAAQPEVAQQVPAAGKTETAQQEVEKIPPSRLQHLRQQERN